MSLWLLTFARSKCQANRQEEQICHSLQFFFWINELINSAFIPVAKEKKLHLAEQWKDTELIHVCLRSGTVWHGKQQIAATGSWVIEPDV